MQRTIQIILPKNPYILNNLSIGKYFISVSHFILQLEYDFVIVNKALARGITIIDKRFDHIIIDSAN